LGANKLPGGSSHIDQFVRDLPDPQGARLFYQNLTAAHPRFAKTLNGDPGLLSDLLALAAWSPLLATTLQQHPEYIQWLARRSHGCSSSDSGSSAGITGAVRADKFFD